MQRLKIHEIRENLENLDSLGFHFEDFMSCVLDLHPFPPRFSPPSPGFWDI
jgi:hypothetical protein